MKLKMRGTKSWLASGVVSICLLCAVGVARMVTAHRVLAQSDSLVDDYQRTYQIDNYTEIAKSGPARGENIYFYKCFVCHNHYAKGGPALNKLIKPAGTSGDSLDDQEISSQIKDGSSGMPGFGHSLNDAEVADLVSYLRSGTCCYEADDPPANPQYLAEAHKWPVQSDLKGGAHGVVRSSDGHTLEGIKVQLIAPNGVRTTVFTNEEGKYEFPVMQAGSYALRIATPAPFKPYMREQVQLNGASSLDEIVLEHMPEAGGKDSLPGALPATQEVEAQLSGSETLWNLPGTDQEKSTFVKMCGPGCHSYQQIFRNRFDERSWRVMVQRMLNYSGNSLIVPRAGVTGLSPEGEMVVKWLAKVRGPESQDQPYRMFERPTGEATRVVITEYEAPRRFLTLHDVWGDSKGNIWYTSHRSPYVGVLDPKTGIVKEYKVPMIPGVMPGTHHVVVDKNDIVWYSENWGHRLTRLDPRTGEFKQMLIDFNQPLNTPAFGNFAMDSDGYVWHGHNGNEIAKIDSRTGEIVKTYPLKTNPTPYNNELSWDGRFWAGGSPPVVGDTTGMILDLRTGKMYETNSGDVPSAGARGGFDPYGNAWFGGHSGPLVEIVNEIDKGKGVHIRSYWPPTPLFPYTEFYSAMPDKNGEIWGGMLHGRGFVRFNPKTDKWVVYDNPEPSALARWTWIDNRTTPVTIWYADFHLGTIIRIQPLE